MKYRHLLVLCAFMLAGCSGDNDMDYGSTDFFSVHRQGLTKANACDDYRAYLLDSEAARIAEDYFNGYDYRIMEVADDMAVPTAEADSSGSAMPKGESAGEFTTTNIQEAGVDEPDIVKNDDQWMYVVHDNSVKVIKAWPAQEMAQVNEIALNGYGQGVFLHDDKLIAISKVYNYADDKPYRSFYGTRIGIYDVSDPTHPALLHTHDIEGSYTDARLVDGKVYVVLNHWLSTYDWEDYDALTKGLPNYSWETLYDMDEDKRQRLIEKYTPVIRARLEKRNPTLDSLGFPKYSDGSQSKDAVSCDNIYMPKMAGRENGMLIVAEISGDNFQNYKARAVADSGWTVYSSTNNIYLVSSSNHWFWYCWDGDSCRNYSQIHRFNFKNGFNYSGTGEIEGFVDNSYWLSEYDGHLRVASDHLSGWWDSSEGYSLSILNLNSMQKVGGLDGIAKGEDIYAVRMLGPKGYIVTFYNTDPLFALDLSNPKAPQIKGDSHVYGYSSYIHPIDDNTLLTIGRDGDAAGTIKGVQFQIFDVSDLSNPQRIAQEVISQDDYNSYSDSVALWDTHAFMYHAPSGLLAVPINMYHWSYNDDSNFSGVVVYRATRENGFERIGIVNHADLLPPNDGTDYYHWWTQLNRSRFYFAQSGEYDKNAFIYTLSDVGIKVSNALAPSETFQTVKY